MEMCGQFHFLAVSSKWLRSAVQIELETALDPVVIW